MNTTEIPSWDNQGTIPPNDIYNPCSENRSPYNASLESLISHFGFSEERREILKGFIELRAKLHELGFNNGFQWIDGSFIENIEIIEQRPPRDIDVVTFYNEIPGVNEEELVNKNPDLFNRIIVKEKFKVDHFFVRLSGEDLIYLINQSTYWYSLWSHRRDNIWKGYLKIDLSKNEENVIANLEELL